MIQSGKAATSVGGWLATAVQLAIMMALTAVAIPAVPPRAAAYGGVLYQVLFLGRIALLVLVATAFMQMRSLRWRDLGLRKAKPGRFFLAILVGFAASFLFVEAARMALQAAGLKATPDYSVFAPLRGNLKLYLFFLLPVTWGSAAFGEEMLFRGYFLDAIRRLLVVEAWPATLLAILVQAALFGALHLYQGPAGAATAGAIGLAFGLAWWSSGRNLWAGILLHGIFDSVAMTEAYLGYLTHH